MMMDLEDDDEDDLELSDYEHSESSKASKSKSPKKRRWSSRRRKKKKVIIDDDAKYGDILSLYQVKWTKFTLNEATWEPMDHLNDAMECIERHNEEKDESDGCMMSQFDNNLLHNLWTVLNEECDDNKYGVKRWSRYNWDIY